MALHRDEKTDPIHILVVDDDPDLRNIFQAGITELSEYKCSTAENGQKALEFIEENKDIDVVITDVNMPEIDGLELLRKIKKQYHSDVIVITGFAKVMTYDKIIELGAKDFILKPVQLKELVVRLKRVLNERALFRELKDAYLDTVRRLALASEFKDEDTGEHIFRMSHYSALIAEKLGMDADDVELILHASPMHDVGKIGVPEHILLKKGKLTPEEFEIAKTHTTIGAKLLANSKSEILNIAETIAISHHEKWNGTGYPKGLSGEDIPLAGRIVALVDTFDAMTEKRPYKDPYPVSVACDIIRMERGEHFDPKLVDIFFENIDAILAIKEQYGSSVIKEQYSLPAIKKQYNRSANISSDNFAWSERDKADGMPLRYSKRTKS